VVCNSMHERATCTWLPRDTFDRLALTPEIIQSKPNKMATEYPLDEKLDSSADQIDDVEVQQERILHVEETNVSCEWSCL
jgi:hypothetical protein